MTARRSSSSPRAVSRHRLGEPFETVRCYTKACYLTSRLHTSHLLTSPKAHRIYTANHRVDELRDALRSRVKTSNAVNARIRWTRDDYVYPEGRRPLRKLSKETRRVNDSLLLTHPHSIVLSAAAGPSHESGCYVARTKPSSRVRGKL